MTAKQKSDFRVLWCATGQQPAIALGSQRTPCAPNHAPDAAHGMMLPEAQRDDRTQIGRVTLLLAIDTATATASVAVYDMERRRLLAETTWQARRRHTQDLMVTVQHMLEQAGVAAAELTALAVTTGPGSFTGVRIGISAVEGLGAGPAADAARGWAAHAVRDGGAVGRCSRMRLAVREGVRLRPGRPRTLQLDMVWRGRYPVATRAQRPRRRYGCRIRGCAARVRRGAGVAGRRVG